MLNNINKIKFANNYIYNIEDFKVKQVIMNYLFNNIELKLLEEVEIKELNFLDLVKKNNFNVIYLEDGNKYILLLKKIKNIYFNVLIKNNFNYNVNNLNYNNLEIYSLDISFPKEYYKGTIIQGNLFTTNNICYFKLYDIIKFKNNDLNKSLKEKYKILNTFQHIKNSLFEFTPAEILEIQDIKQKNINGLLFLSDNENKKYYIYFTKKISKIYSTLLMKKINTDVFNLFAVDNDNKKINLNIAHIPNLKTSKFFNNYTEEIVVKCWYNEIFNKWVPFELLDENTIIDNIDNINNKIIKV